MLIDLQFPYEISIPGLYEAIVIKKTANKYDIVFPVCEEAGNIRTLVKKVKVIEFNRQTGEFTEVGSYPLDFLGFYAPHLASGGVGYDLDNDRIILGIGEGDPSKSTLSTTNMKIVAVNRSLDGHEILIDDLFSLLKSERPSAQYIQLYGSCYIINSLGVIATRFYDVVDTTSRVCGYLGISTDGGETWAWHIDLEYQNLRVEPFWYGTTFQGYLIAREVYPIWVKNDGTYTEMPYSLWTFTEVTYDMINDEIIYHAQLAANGYMRKTSSSNPIPPSSGDLEDITPSGTITNEEGATIDLTRCRKELGIIVEINGQNYLVFIITQTVNSTVYRHLLVTTLPVSAGNTYELVHYSGGDLIDFLYTSHMNLIRAFDISTKRAIPSPLVNIIPA